MPVPEHLQMIQAIVDRMGRNSFLLKGWSVTLAVALIGLAADKANADFAVVAAGATTMLWLLDAYYLAVERRYRVLYREAVNGSVPTWTLNAGTVVIRDMAVSVSRPTVAILHGSVLVCSIAVAASGGSV